MRRLVLLAALLASPSIALAQPAPSGPHPRLFMSASDLAAYQADVSDAQSPTARAIRDCQNAIDNPGEQMTRGGADGNTWPLAAMSCAFAYRVTSDPSYLTQALASWRHALDDDQTAGDRLGCVAGVSTDWQSWDGNPPAPPVILTVTHDTGYPIRWYGPFLALTYDWLYDAPGVDDALRGQTRTCLGAWNDWYHERGYHHDEAGANYGAGFVLSQAVTGVAIGTDGGSDGHVFTNAIATYRDVLIAEGLRASPAGPMVDGDWLEGWQYGPFSVLEYALGARILIDAGVDLPEMSDWTNALIVRHLYGLTPSGDAQWAGGGDFDSTDVYPTPSLNVIHAVLVGPSSDTAASYAASLDEGSESTFPVYGAFAHLRAVTAADFTATTPAPATWFLSRGSRTVYARSAWTPSALWTVFQSAPALVSDHQHFAASNFVLSRGSDALIVDSSQYGAPNTLETNAITVDSPQLEMHDSYAGSQTPWSEAAMPWARSSDGVVAARSELADAFIFSSNPSDIAFARRDWVFLPEGNVVTIDRATTADTAHALHVRFHANTGGGGGLAQSGDVFSGTVGGSLLTIVPVATSGGTPSVIAPDHLGDSSTCTTNYPSGDCNDARFAVDIYALAVPGPHAVAVHVIGASAPGMAPTVSDASSLGADVIGASVFSTTQSYVLASSADEGAAGATMTYAIPAAGASRHVVFDAPEASDGTSSVVVAAGSGGDCVVTITAGAGGGFLGRPLMFSVSSASDGCTATDGADTPPGEPPVGGSDAGPRPDGGPNSQRDAGPGGAPASSGCGCRAGGATRASLLTWLALAAILAARGRARRG